MFTYLTTPFTSRTIWSNVYNVRRHLSESLKEKKDHLPGAAISDPAPQLYKRFHSIKKSATTVE